MPVAPVGTASLATPDAFWTQVLVDMGAPVTQSNIEALRAWSEREGGGGAWNPLNTTRPEAGSTSFNKVGVQNYTSASQGAQATADSIRNGRYPSILAAFMTGSAFEALVSGGKGPIGSQLRTWSGGGYNNISYQAGLYVSPSLGGLKTQGHGATPPNVGMNPTGAAANSSCQTLAETMANAGPVPGAQIPAFFVWITQGCVEKRLLIQGTSLFLILYGLKFMGHSEPIKIVTAPIGAAGKAGAMFASE